jgi:hypothetical protein
LCIMSDSFFTIVLSYAYPCLILRRILGKVWNETWTVLQWFWSLGSRGKDSKRIQLECEID